MGGSTISDAELTLLSRSPSATRRIGAALGRLLRGGEVLLLVGDLGSGKTAFVQGIAQGMGIAGPLPSPTFTLVNEHAAPERALVLYHIDLYRLSSAAEALDLGLAELLGAPHAVCAVEWADRAPAVAPAEHLRLELTITGARRRRLRFRAGGPAHAALLDALREALGTETDTLALSLRGARGA